MARKRILVCYFRWRWPRPYLERGQRDGAVAVQDVLQQLRHLALCQRLCAPPPPHKN